MLPVRFARQTNPFRTFDNLLEGLDRWSEAVTPGFGSAISRFRVDVREDDHGLIIEAEVPGFNRDEIDVTVDQGVLTITAEHKSETEDKKEGYHIRERQYGRLERSFRLPSTADGENVAAELKDGLLTLRVPTREEAKPRKIAVK
jgi:HSP20 family protein